MPPNVHDPAGLGRRGTAPSLNAGPPQVLMKLHVDYLSAQSTLLRALFSGASPLDLISGAPPPAHSARPSISHPARLPRLLNSNARHPVVFLPIPDPASFHHLVTWMYFGTTGAIERALRDRAIRWEGIARNVEYLGMPQELKLFLGRWYSQWLQTQAARPRAPPYHADSDIEEEDEVAEMVGAGDWEADAPRGRSRDRTPGYCNGVPPSSPL
ncbi:hypothetical protein BV25DRAFT_1823145 [Artomyces pyxidatus]|uniref:Uncharacterized protein n=1 Tax=Artomyces pyxidatus TaxID=48021 RepID=A0ACB8T790_9AGAM|nr:hypothetical protein BV25DRAFT_1823145 [Artomyces pyxidatus]